MSKGKNAIYVNPPRVIIDSPPHHALALANPAEVRVPIPVAVQPSAVDNGSGINNDNVAAPRYNDEVAS